jgi:molecular chaperone HscB
MNFFAYYGLPVSVELDKADLRQRYYQKSREVHPDHQSDADLQAAMNNEALRVLVDETARLKHILELHQITSLDHEPLPTAFLMEMMELNEAIEEADSPEKAQALNQIVEAYASELDLSLAPIREKWPSDPTKINEALDLLKNFVIKRKYLLRIKENLSKFAAS